MCVPKLDICRTYRCVCVWWLVCICLLERVSAYMMNVYVEYLLTCKWVGYMHVCKCMVVRMHVFLYKYVTAYVNVCMLSTSPYM